MQATVETDENLLERISPRVRKLARRYAALTRNSRNSLVTEDDLFQVAMIAAWRRLAKGWNPRLNSLWGFIGLSVDGAMRNFCFRAKAKTVSLSLEQAELIEDQSADDSPETACDFAAFVKQLCPSASDRQLKVLSQRFVNDKTFEEIGKEFGLTSQRIGGICNELLQKIAESAQAKGWPMTMRGHDR